VSNHPAYGGYLLFPILFFFRLMDEDVFGVNLKTPAQAVSSPKKKN